jgi:exodeoxyribonuclease VII large subunit
MTALTVSQFVELTNQALGALGRVVVEGEIAEYKVIHQKWVVFDLKDEDCLVKCFMAIWQLKGELEDGMMVRAVGQPKLRDKGFFSFVLDSVQPTGEGALRRAFELLKQKLENEGLFAPQRKRVLPRFPERIGLVTSRDAAAYSDFVKVLQERLGGLEIVFTHTPVQGEEAPEQIVAALETINSLSPPPEALVLVRGGGSLEDLHAFNDERVVRAVANSRVPTIVGVGHERDLTLADFAADQRASTPSNAAELLVRTRAELRGEVREREREIRQAIREALERERRLVRRAIVILRKAVREPRETLLAYQTALRHRFMAQMTTTGVQLKNLVRLLTSLSPTTTLQRGFSITRTESGEMVTSQAKVRAGMVLVTQLKKGEVRSSVAGQQLDLGLKDV